ncbi:pentatricopeptide repeat-containing protein At5g66520-like [Typha angustifolia]|uniref:pentatricopeptide repeat-containing protein At5g66520-like n=1 Tax=Typha angustifolia TaxID=59011 RepID=UPI003C2F383B
MAAVPTLALPSTPTAPSRTFKPNSAKPPWMPTPQLLSQHPTLHHLLSCTSMSHLHQIHAQTITSGAFRDNFVASRILSFAALSPDGSLPYARLVFSRIPKPDAFVANVLIRAYASGSDPLEALHFYTHVLESPVVDFPDVHTFPLLLKVCSRVPSLPFGKMVHAQVFKLGWDSTASVQNFLVYMYASCGLVESARLAFDGISELNDASVNMMLDGYLKCGHFDDARKMFDEINDRDVLSWSVMINGYVQDSCFKEGLDLFHEMLKENKEPNESVLVNVLSACAHLGAVEQGMWVEGYVRKKDICLSVRIGTALVDMYLKCGCVEKAFEVFNMMKDKNSTTCSAMISGLAINGCAKDALKLFSQMEMNGIVPNEVTFVGVLNACSHSGLVDEGVNYFNSMKKLYGVRPNVHHYCCLVDLYGRAGLLDEAEDVIEKMPMKANSAIWGALLNSCRIHKDAILGERIGKKLLELEPTNSGRYALLSNIYAVNGRWEDVAALRRLMKERGVNKTPGSSFIDLKGAVHEFIAGDNYHPQRGEIYAMLDEMRRKLTMVGYRPRTDQILIDMDEEDKSTALFHHSEKLAVAFGLIHSDPGTTIRITKNLRVCIDCHLVMKLLSKIYHREIIVRDRCRFHHFKDATCSCMDYW